MYYIRNDVTGYVWLAYAAEAKLYAIGGVFDTYYSMFKDDGSMVGLCVNDFSI